MLIIVDIKDAIFSLRDDSENFTMIAFDPKTRTHVQVDINNNHFTVWEGAFVPKIPSQLCDLSSEQRELYNKVVSLLVNRPVYSGTTLYYHGTIDDSLTENNPIIFNQKPKQNEITPANI